MAREVEPSTSSQQLLLQWLLRMLLVGCPQQAYGLRWQLPMRHCLLLECQTPQLLWTVAGEQLQVPAACCSVPSSAAAAGALELPVTADLRVPGLLFVLPNMNLLPGVLTCALGGCWVPAAGAGRLLDVVRAATATTAQSVRLVAALTCNTQISELLLDRMPELVRSSRNTHRKTLYPCRTCPWLQAVYMMLPVRLKRSSQAADAVFVKVCL
jgi:hypothetical protein